MGISLPENPNQNSATLGKDYLVDVNTGTANSPVWTLVGAQKSADLNRSADSIDTSHKTSGGWKSSKPGLRGWSIDLGALMLLQDDGIAALDYAFNNGKEVNVRLRYPDGSAQTGWGGLTDFSLSTPHDGPAELKGTIEGDGELTARAPSVTPASATVSKASPADKVFTITPGTATVSAVKIDGSSVTITTGYTYSSGTLTIKSATCGALAVGSHTIEVTTGDGAVLTMLLIVTA